jgi:hypothetical protein
MEPKDFSNAFNRARYEIRITLNRKGQIQEQEVQKDAFDTVLEMKECEGFPEANEVINRIKAL